MNEKPHLRTLFIVSLAVLLVAVIGASGAVADNTTDNESDDDTPQAILDVGESLTVTDYEEDERGLLVTVHTERNMQVGYSASYSDTYYYDSVTVNEGENRILIPHEDAEVYGISADGEGRYLETRSSDPLLPNINPRVSWVIGIGVMFIGLVIKAKKRQKDERNKQERLA